MEQEAANELRFVKEIVSSHGQVHRVPVQNVYVTGAVDRDHAAAEAIERFQFDHRVADWRVVADDLEVEEAA